MFHEDWESESFETTKSKSDYRFYERLVGFPTRNKSRWYSRPLPREGQSRKGLGRMWPGETAPVAEKTQHDGVWGLAILGEAPDWLSSRRQEPSLIGTAVGGVASPMFAGDVVGASGYFS